MQFFIAFLLSIIAVALQITWLSRLTILTVAPNLILAGVLAWAICPKEEKNYRWILLPVLMFDLLAGQPFGLFTLSLWLMFFSVELLASLLFKQNDLPAILLLTVIGLVFFEFYQFLLQQFFALWHLTEPIKFSAFYGYAVLPVKIFYNGLVVLLGLVIFKKSKLLSGHGQIPKLK